jgi:hypothetical protein
MDAIHVNWTKPFLDKFGTPYSVEDFEILTTILSALKWREKNGAIKMITDSVGAEFYEKNGLCEIWDDVLNVLDDVDVNPKMFWAAGKLFALSRENAPMAMIDTDFIVWETLDFDNMADVSIIHFEDLYPDVYPRAEHFRMKDYEVDREFDWDLKACNTAFCIVKNNEFLKYYTSCAIDFMRAADEENDFLTYMVFAEQRLIAMCAKKMNVSLSALSDLETLFKNGDNRFTHTWGMKQQMRDNEPLRRDFCRRCINRIVHEYPHMYEIMKNIDVLKQYF